MIRTDLKNLEKLVGLDINLRDDQGFIVETGVLTYVPAGVSSAEYHIGNFHFSQGTVKKVTKGNLWSVKVREYLDKRQNAGVVA